MEIRVAEWLGQARNRAPFEQSRTDHFVAERGDENDRDLIFPERQFLSEIGSGHAGHCDVEDETFRLKDAARSQKFLGRTLAASQARTCARKVAP
jgi:hypothetical protein